MSRGRSIISQRASDSASHGNPSRRSFIKSPHGHLFSVRETHCLHLDAMSTTGTGNKQISLSKLLLTWPQCECTKEELLESLKESLPEFDVYVIAKEHHKEGGGHLHAAIKLNKPRRVRISGQNLSKLFDVKGHHCDVEFLKSGKDWQKAVKYCCKEGDYISGGIDIEALKNRSEHNSHKKIYTCKQILETPINELVNNDMISAHSFSTVYRAQLQWKLLSTPNTDLCGPRGMWFYGPAGTGKSMQARIIGMQEGGYYLKAQNKWWDGYQNEPVVIIDDLDTSILSHYLKIWGDRYSFHGETKGGTLPIPCKKIIVTSNYSIEELLRKDSRNGDVDVELWHAIKRRYKEVFFNHVWTMEETEAFNVQQEDEAAKLLREEQKAANEPQNKKAPALYDDVQTPIIEETVLQEVPKLGEIDEDGWEAPQESNEETVGNSNTIILEGHTALNLFPDTNLSGYRE